MLQRLLVGSVRSGRRYLLLSAGPRIGTERSPHPIEDEGLIGFVVVAAGVVVVVVAAVAAGAVVVAVGAAGVGPVVDVVAAVLEGVVEAAAVVGCHLLLELHWRSGEILPFSGRV